MSRTRVACGSAHSCGLCRHGRVWLSQVEEKAETQPQHDQR
ncbi:RCC1 domain-containing protein [Planctomycetota bacterium]